MACPAGITTKILLKLKRGFDVWDALFTGGTISQNSANERKAPRLKEEVQKHSEMENRKAVRTSFTKEKKDDNTWKKSISNAVNAFSLHDANYTADSDA